MLKKMKIKMLVIVSFLLVGLIPMLFIAYESMTNAETALEEESFAKLAAINILKESRLEAFFEERLADIRVLADNPFVKEAFLAMDAALDEAGGQAGGQLRGDGNHNYTAPDSYKEVHDRYDKN